MNGLRRETLVHGALLGAAVLAAALVWGRDKEPRAAAQGDVVVWSARAGDVERIRYEGKQRRVSLEARKDAGGRYFVGSVERDAPAGGAADAGAPSAPKASSLGFVSVGPGEKLAEALAPLKALRALGRVGPDRAAEFGLAEPEGTITVRVGGAEHTLAVGAATPGGGDRYVRASSGEVYVLKGEPIRNLESPDSLLLERELHEWKDSEVTRARVEAGGKARDLVRAGPESKRFWADAASPDANDETLGNWMSKLDRLRPTEYATTPIEGQEPVVRIEYAGRKPLGHVELVRVKGADKPTYYLRTERTRLFGKVASTVAEQLEQDVGTIVR
jgi:hypothetical protein